MKKLLLIFILLFIGLKGYAQDFHFSQFYVLPTFLNPAYVGKFRTDYRFGLIHRRQWMQIKTPYTTSGATGEINFRVGPMKYDLVGVGLAFVNDELGDGIFKNQYVILSGAYHRYLDEFLRHRISAGVQGTYFRQNIGSDNLYFANQYDPNSFQFNNQLPSGEFSGANAFTQQKLLVNAGFAYNFKVSEKFEFESGISAFNINAPEVNNAGKPYKLPPRLLWNGMLNYRISPSFSVIPQFQYIYQGKAQNPLGGALFGYHLKNIKKPIVYAGGFYRLNESVIPTVALSYNFFYFGISYDLVTGAPKEITSVPALNRTSLGSLEFTLIYNGFLKRQLPGKISVPCGIL